MKNKYTLLMRHVLEVRFKNKAFSLIDTRGKIIDFLVKEGGFEQVKIALGRVDVSTKDLSEFFFFSIENFGFQLEAVDNFDIFKTKTDTLFSLIDKYKDYKINDVIRLGTKSEILCHIKGKNFDELKNIFKKKLFKDFEKIEQKTSFKLNDYAFVSDFIKDEGKANILMGPVTKDEVIQKYFNNHEKYKNFDKKNGIYLAIDYCQNQGSQIKQDKLKEQVKINIDNIKKLYEDIVSYFTDNINGT